MMTIIAATDFSILAENAVEYAAAIAKHKNARLILFNSFVIPFHAANTLLPASSIQALMIDNEIRLLERAFSLSYDYEIEVGHESAFSFIEDELKELIKKYNAELVVLGMQKKKTLEQDLWGNTTSFAIRNLKIPVLAVPQNARFEGTKKVLFACDVLRGLSKKALSRVKEVAIDLKAQVEVFNVDQKLEILRSEAEHSSVVNVLDDGLDGVTYYYKNVKSIMVIREIEKEIIEFQADL
ncbi:universal stress protein [Pedobacter sp. NJ-S-72]